MTGTVTRAGTEGAQPPAQSRSGLAGMVDLGRDTVRRVLRPTRSTPGKLYGLMALILVLCTVVAAVGGVLVDDRQDTIDGLVEHREPQAAAAQSLYRVLSDADVTVGRSLLSDSGRSDRLQQRYENDIAQAGAALAKAASDTGRTAAGAEQVAILAKQLPVYTGLVEQARTGGDAGAATYLNEAAEVMRSSVLPAARELYRINTAQLQDEQDEATGFPWTLTVLVLVLLAALVAAQVYLKRRTNRVFNVGLGLASVAVVTMVLWGATALTVQTVLVNGGSNSTAQENLLVRARTTALRARANEMYMLMARDEAGRYQAQFTELARKLAGEQGHGGLLSRARAEAEQSDTTQYIDSAGSAARSWLGIHRVVRKFVATGSSQEAVSLAIDARDGGSATPTFTRLDDSIAKAVTTARERFNADTTGASTALTLLAPGVIVLSILAALGATVGLRDRLREYR